MTWSGSWNDSSAVVIEEGSPWQNAYVESFNGKIRDELLAIEKFTTLLEAKIMAEDFRQHYNNPGLRKILAH
jgi:putative transposase